MKPAVRAAFDHETSIPPCSARCAALALAALLAACSVGPDYRPPATPAPASWSAPIPDAESNATDDPAALATWWRHFDDPLLEHLIERALAANPDVHSAQARVREARAAREQALAAWYPTAGISVSRSDSHGHDTNGRGQTNRLYRAGFDAGWEIDLFGGTRRANEAAQAELEAVRADLYALRISLAAEVALDYTDLRRLQQQLDIAQRNLDMQTETAQIAGWRTMAGLASALDAEQAIAAREQTRARIPALTTALAQTRHRLGTLLADPAETTLADLARPQPIPLPQWQLAVGIPADALRRRPDVHAAERRLAAATARIGVATAARYPSLSLSGTLGLQARTFSGLDAHDTGSRSLGSSLAATLFDAGRLRREVEIGNAREQQALAAWESTVFSALEETADALAALDGSQREHAALGDAAAAARTAATLARAQYEAGLIDFATLLLAERTRLDAESAVAAARADAAGAMIRLYKSLGGGWDPATDTKDRG